MLADEYKHSMPTTNPNVIKNLQINTFHKFESLNGTIPPLYIFRMLSEVCILNLQNQIWKLIRGIPMVKLTLHLVHLLMGFTSTMHSFYYDNVKLSNWQRRKLPELLCMAAMMTSSNGNIFRVTGHLCREFTGLRWIPRTKASDAELWCFLWSAPGWTVEWCFLWSAPGWTVE